MKNRNFCFSETFSKKILRPPNLSPKIIIFSKLSKFEFLEFHQMLETIRDEMRKIKIDTAPYATDMEDKILISHPG